MEKVHTPVGDFPLDPKPLPPPPAHTPASEPGQRPVPADAPRNEDLLGKITGGDGGR